MRIRDSRCCPNSSIISVPIWSVSAATACVLARLSVARFNVCDPSSNRDLCSSSLACGIGAFRIYEYVYGRNEENYTCFEWCPLKWINQDVFMMKTWQCPLNRYIYDTNMADKHDNVPCNFNQTVSCMYTYSFGYLTFKKIFESVFTMFTEQKKYTKVINYM